MGIISNNGERKSVPSFAGNINIGRLEPQTGSDRFNQARPTTTTTPAPAFNNFQQNQFTRQQQRPQQQQPQQQFNPAGPKTQSLFDQIKERINREKAAKAAILRKQNTNDQPASQQPQPSPQPTQPRPQPTQPTFRQQNFGTFGVFEAVDLSSGPNPTSAFSP